MTEAVFPLLGPLLVFGLALPALALAMKLLLLAVRRREGLHFWLRLRYVLLVASSGVPLVWLISAGLHQAESGRIVEVCIAPHGPDALCLEAIYFALALVGLSTLFALPRLIWEQVLLRGSPSEAALRVRERIARLIQGNPRLHALEGGYVVRDTLRHTLVTVGVISPRLVIRTSFTEELDDESLIAVLHHEIEHVIGRDPLRYFVAWWALAINPVGRWILNGELARWVLAREIHCDREAVLAGASAPALAHSLVRGSRPASRSSAPALGAGNLAALRLRVGLLLAYSEQPPVRCCRGPALRVAVALLVLVFALPHSVGTGLLDVLHAASERAGGFLIGW
ncbi:MAG: hypothetical protein R3A51_21355 [Nannocystaceae bacterium]